LLLQVQQDTPSQFVIPTEGPVTALELNIPTAKQQINNPFTLQATYTCDATPKSGVEITFTLKVAGTQTAGSPATVKCTTDATGACSATVPASATAVKYDVTAAAPNCDSTGTVDSSLKTGSGSTIEWTAGAPDGITLTIATPTVNVGQTNEVSASLRCNGVMQAGSTVSAACSPHLMLHGQHKMPCISSGQMVLMLHVRSQLYRMHNICAHIYACLHCQHNTTPLLSLNVHKAKLHLLLGRLPRR
jgi:hypothetical protein